MSIVVENQIKVHRWALWFLAKRLAYQLDLKRYTLSGSYRRGKWWCNDIDLLVPVQSDSEIEGIKARLHQLGWRSTPYRRTNAWVFSYQYMKKIDDKYLVLDLFLSMPGTWGNALLFTTGSKTFNDKIRRGLADKGYTWSNPRYFTKIESNEQLSFSTEKGALNWLGIPWVKPSKRT